MKFIDAIGLKYFYDKLKDKFVQRITYNKKTSADDTIHTDIERAIETPLIIGGKKNGSSDDTSLVLQHGNASFEDDTGNYIKITNSDVDIVSSYSIHLEGNVGIGPTPYYQDNKGIFYQNDKITLNADYVNSKCSQVYTGGYWLEAGTPTNTNLNIRVDTKLKVTFNKWVGTFYDGLKLSSESGSTVIYNFSSTETRLLKDVITASKTQIRNRLSSTCSTKLTEAKGFQVFTNLYADPEHCTDIADYTDTEKAILTNNTVQKNILELNKTKTFVDSIKTSNSSIKLTNSYNLYIANNIIDENGITLQTKINGIGNTEFKDVLSLTRTGIKLFGGSANKVFATDGSVLDLSKMVTTEIPSSSWKTSTPFNILDDVVTNIYKGETVGNYTKWILIPYADTENKKYTAYKKGNADYIYSNYAFNPSQPLLPWEFWLPSNLAVNTVEVDW